MGSARRAVPCLSTRRASLKHASIQEQVTRVVTHFIIVVVSWGIKEYSLLFQLLVFGQTSRDPGNRLNSLPGMLNSYKGSSRTTFPHFDQDKFTSLHKSPILKSSAVTIIKMVSITLLVSAVRLLPPAKSTPPHLHKLLARLKP